MDYSDNKSMTVGGKTFTAREIRFAPKSASENEIQPGSFDYDKYITAADVNEMRYAINRVPALVEAVGNEICGGVDEVKSLLGTDEEAAELEGKLSGERRAVAVRNLMSL